MPYPLRLFVSVISAIAAFYFAMLIPGSFLVHLPAGPFIVQLGSLVAAIFCGRYVWQQISAGKGSLSLYSTLGALILGGIGFCAGFFGPMIFAPQANQGPLLGLFITGPLGFLLGGILGAVYWKFKG